MKSKIDIIIDIGSIVTLLVIALLFVIPWLFPNLPIDPQFLIAIATVVIYAIRWIIRKFR